MQKPSEWIRVSERMPKIGVVVNAQLEGFSTKRIVEADLIHVDEDDCTWRTADDYSEISYSFNVIFWREKQPSEPIISAK